MFEPRPRITPLVVRLFLTGLVVEDDDPESEVVSVADVSHLFRGGGVRRRGAMPLS